MSNPEVSNISTEDEDIKLFKTYLYQSKILIVDPCKPAIKRLKDILVDLGAQKDKVILCVNDSDAVAALEDVRPNIFISEYYLPGEDVFELFKKFNEARPENKKCLSVIITSGSNHAFVAKAAEENLDAFLIRPYKSDFIKQMLFDSAIKKINPSKYLRMVEIAKGLIVEDKLKEASDLLTEAQSMVEDPALALYYQGQIDILNDAMANAGEKFRSGLEGNEVHFKSLESLFSNLMEENKILDAYEVIKKMISYFPFSSERLSQVLKLSVMTENYLDIEDYYKVYKETRLDDQTLKKYICAALITMGKYYLGDKDAAKAIDAFKRAGSILCDGIMLKNIVEILCDYQLGKDAEYFMSLFKEEDKASEDYKICHFLTYALSSSDLQRVIDEGKGLIYEDFISNKIVFKFLEFYMKQNGNDEDVNTLSKKRDEIFS